MKSFSTISSFVALSLACAPSSDAATTILSESPSLFIPDGSSSGIARVLSLSGSLQTIDSIELALHIAAMPGEAAFLGDLYAYLTNGTEIAVLLNRPGRTSTAPGGYGDNQTLNVTFKNSAANDIHLYRIPTTGSATNPLTGALTGDWLPDGRTTDPANVLDTDTPTARLDVFNSDSADQDWTLFVADLSAGGQHRLVSWTLTLNTVPEPSALLLLSGAVPLLLRRRR